MLSWDFFFPFHVLVVLSDLLRTCDFSWALGFLTTSEAESCTLGSVNCCLSSVYELNKFFFFNHFNINALTNYRFRLWLTKLLVIESSIYPKVVVPRTWILLSFWFYFGFFLPHYFHSSFQRSCYTQPAKGNSLLKRSVSYKYVTDLFITYWRI